MIMQFPASAFRLKEQRKVERKERDARRGKLGDGRFDSLVKELARVIRLAFEAGDTGSLFGLEGPLRAGIRSDLCRQGWGWTNADLAACDLLDDAFRIARAVRPSWNEGQPEWTIHEGLLIERTRCVNCGKHLPPENHKFCSRLCGDAHSRRLARVRQDAEGELVQIATRRT